MNDPASPEVAAVATVGNVLTDLVEVAEQLPVQPDQAEATARILDRLSEEIGEAAAMLRGATAPEIRLPQSDPCPCDPWSIVSLVTHDLARGGVKARFGAGADLTAAAGHAAQLLDALGVAPGDNDAVVPAPRRPRADGSVPVDDARVTAARALLAEHHQPLTMTPGDVRGLLARTQRRLFELLAVVDGQAAPVSEGSRALAGVSPTGAPPGAGS